MNRRAFLGVTATSAAGLVVGAAALEAWDRLTWKRRVFPSAPLILTTEDAQRILTTTGELRNRHVLIGKGESLILHGGRIVECRIGHASGGWTVIGTRSPATILASAGEVMGCWFHKGSRADMVRWLST